MITATNVTQQKDGERWLVLYQDKFEIYNLQHAEKSNFYRK